MVKLVDELFSKNRVSYFTFIFFFLHFWEANGEHETETNVHAFVALQ